MTIINNIQDNNYNDLSILRHNKSDFVGKLMKKRVNKKKKGLKLSFRTGNTSLFNKSPPINKIPLTQKNSFINKYNRSGGTKSVQINHRQNYLK